MKTNMRVTTADVQGLKNALDNLDLYKDGAKIDKQDLYKEVLNQIKEYRSENGLGTDDWKPGAGEEAFIKDLIKFLDERDDNEGEGTITGDEMTQLINSHSDVHGGPSSKSDALDKGYEEVLRALVDDEFEPCEGNYAGTNQWANEVFHAKFGKE
jgi:hypothetical protein